MRCILNQGSTENTNYQSIKSTLPSGSTTGRECRKHRAFELQNLRGLHANRSAREKEGGKIQGATQKCGAGDPWQQNWKPEKAERSHCYGETRVQQVEVIQSCCPGHLWLAGICPWSGCSTNRTQTCAVVGCQGPALSLSSMQTNRRISLVGMNPK